MKVSLKSTVLVFAFLISAVPPGLAQAAESEFENNLVQGGHSGAWFDSAEPGHGLFIEVLSDSTSPTGKEILVAWFAFFDGMQIWLIAQGDVVEVDDGQVALLDAFIYTGNDFPPIYDADQTESIGWGTLMLNFTGCDQAHLEWDSVIEGYGTGELELQRLTTIAGSICDPDLGGNPDADDHGDTWPTGTVLSDLGSSTEKLSASLEEEGDVDVFVFSISSNKKFICYTFGSQSVNSTGILYEIDGSKEVEIVESDEHPTDSKGFWIEENISAGTYSVHVKGRTETDRGDYQIYYRVE